WGFGLCVADGGDDPRGDQPIRQCSGQLPRLAVRLLADLVEDAPAPRPGCQRVEAVQKRRRDGVLLARPPQRTPTSLPIDLSGRSVDRRLAGKGPLIFALELRGAWPLAQANPALPFAALKVDPHVAVPVDRFKGVLVMARTAAVAHAGLHQKPSH